MLYEGFFFVVETLEFCLTNDNKSSHFWPKSTSCVLSQLMNNDHYPVLLSSNLIHLICEYVENIKVSLGSGC